VETKTLVAEPGSIVRKCLAAMPGMDDPLRKRLTMLEAYDLGFLLLGMSPRRLLRDGRLFDNEQVLPLLLWFGQWDKHCRHWAAEIMRQWLVFNPSEGDFEGVSDEQAVEFRDYFFERHAIPLIEEFRHYVALTMLYPTEHNAPSGPVDMVWHGFLLDTQRYKDFSDHVWLGGGAPATRGARGKLRDHAASVGIGVSAVVPDPDTAIQAFHEQGYVVLRNVVHARLVRRLRNLMERRFEDPATHTAGPAVDLVRGNVSLMRMFEYHRAFRDMIEAEPILGLVELILGNDCHVIAQNALRTPAGKGIVNWHIDDALFFPFLERLARLPGPDVVNDALPCFSLTVMMPLSDVDDERHGPTQVVPGSHRLGRKPPYGPTLPDGIAPVSLSARAGDAYLVNSQTWHRGAQNQSDRIRYLLTTTYGRRFISQRFFPFLNYRMPSAVLAGASDRQRRLLGQHVKGPYG
jgi:ectoine hydroxylase-related dioxygenase (phytanoyl-CoA dioxygenase family)